MSRKFNFRATVAATAATFEDEFPGQEPSRSWLAVAADVDHVPDARREEWFDAVCARVATLRIALGRPDEIAYKPEGAP